MITVNNLSKIYAENKQVQYPALSGVNLTVEEGEFIAVIGPSGAGKSTLLHIMACIDRPTAGTVEIDGINVSNLSDKKLANIRNSVLSVILQDFALLEDFTVFDNVLMPLCFTAGKKAQKRAKATEVLTLLHIENLAKKKIRQLSGGQKQRVAIARALITSPRYIFADEPTGSLDSKTSDEIMKILLELNRKNITIVMVTHNMELAAQCKRQITIKDGRIIEDCRK